MVGCLSFAGITAGCLSGSNYACSSDSIKTQALAGDFSMAGSGSADGVAIEPVPFTTNSTGRSMVYDATLHITVPSFAVALRSVVELAESLGGHMQSMTEKNVTIRVPAGRFPVAIQKIEALGALVTRSIQGTDVTEEITDLDIRLKNLEKMHVRLLAVMEKGGKIEELLAIEKELQRVTEEIELIKGKALKLRDQVALSTISVYLNSPLPQKQVVEVIPFPWVQRLATRVRLTDSVAFSPDSSSRSWLRFDLPDGFVRVHERKGMTRAMSGDGVSMLISREENFEEATAEFWQQIIKRWLSAGKAIAITGVSDLKLKSGALAKVFACIEDMGGVPHGYVLGMVATEDYVYTFEAWGRQDKVVARQTALSEAIQSMAIRPFETR
jgi:hypothetical protein